MKSVETRPVEMRGSARVGSKENREAKKQCVDLFIIHYPILLLCWCFQGGANRINHLAY